MNLMKIVLGHSSFVPGDWILIVISIVGELPIIYEIQLETFLANNLFFDDTISDVSIYIY